MGNKKLVSFSCAKASSTGVLAILFLCFFSIVWEKDQKANGAAFRIALDIWVLFFFVIFIRISIRLEFCHSHLHFLQASLAFS